MFVSQHACVRCITLRRRSASRQTQRLVRCAVPSGYGRNSPKGVLPRQGAIATGMEMHGGEVKNNSRLRPRKPPRQRNSIPPHDPNPAARSAAIMLRPSAGSPPVFVSSGLLPRHGPAGIKRNAHPLPTFMSPKGRPGDEHGGAARRRPARTFSRAASSGDGPGFSAGSLSLAICISQKKEPARDRAGALPTPIHCLTRPLAAAPPGSGNAPARLPPATRGQDATGAPPPRRRAPRPAAVSAVARCARTRPCSPGAGRA